MATREEMIVFLTEWAAENGGVLTLKGTAGFGRPCVGILVGDHYPDWSDHGIWEHVFRKNEPATTFVSKWEVPEAAPPEGVDNAYHKHNCLCVLGQDSGALEELYIWVKNLKKHDIVVKEVPRQPKDQIDLAIHGTTTIVLTHRDREVE